MSVLLETSEGDIVIDLLVDHAPKLCENFLKLCKVKYYNFSPVHSVQKNFSFQTGDPLGPLSKDSDGGSSIWGHVSGDPAKRTFPAFFHPKLKHLERGTVSMATAPLQSDPDTRVAGSQFIVTLGEDTDYLDGKAAIFGKVVEGFEVLDKINEAIVDEKGYPLIDIRIKHTVILDDPYPDPPGLREPSSSPPPTAQQLKTVRIEDEAALHADDNVDEEELERRRRNREAQAQALTLEMMGDLPFAEVKPPENVLFVCKLNPVTGDEDLELIFGRFGKILSCEVIRDQKTGDSLQYAFIEFEDKASCEAAYFKMQDVLIDDRRIHVDFSQSVSKLSDVWRRDTNSKRRATAHRGGWGGVDELEKRRQYRDEGEKITGDWGAVDRNRRRMMRLLQDLRMMKGHHVDEVGVGVGVRGQEIEVGIDIANHEMTVKATGAIEIMIETDIGTVATIVETEVKKGIDLDGTIMIAGQGDKEGLVDCETQYSSATLTSTGVLRRNTIDGKRLALLCYATASANFNTECIVRHYTKMEYPHNTSLTATLKENLVAEFNALLRDMQTPTSSHLTYGPSPEFLLQATEDNVDYSVEHTLNTVYA
ncbi:cyclophilin-like domain-containing protein [Fusarium oxysporum]|nr:cyclophilin-like domain-containing protein [Fusarium oxysporum]